MIKVKCEACDAPYEVDPRRIPASGLRMRCPACGASVHVNSPGGADDVDLPAPKGASALERDLPAPKPAAPGSRQKATQVGLGMPALDPPRAARAAAAPPRADLADLPAAKAHAPRLAPAFDDLDLPAPKGDLDLPAAKARGAGRVGSGLTDDLTDLPAPRTPQAAARQSPARGEPTTNLFGDHHADLPAAKPEPSAPGRRGPAPGAAPARSDAKLAKDSLAMDPEPFFAALKRGSALEDLDDLATHRGRDVEPADLPAAKVKAARTAAASPAKPAPQATKMGLGLPPGTKLPKDSLDLPSAIAAAQRHHAPDPFGDDEAGLPAPADLPAVRGAKPAAKGGPNRDEIDLPAPQDLPAVKARPGAGRPAAGDEIDLPAPHDLPAVKAQRAGPAIGLRGEIDLPASGDLPTVKAQGPRAAPAPGTAMGLGPLSMARDSLDLPAHGDLPRVQPFDAGTGTAMGIGHPRADADLPAPGDLPQLRGPAGDFAFSMGDGLDLPPAPAAPGLGSFDLDRDLGASFGGQSPPDFGGGFGQSSVLDALDRSLDLPPSRGGMADPSSLIDLSKLALPGNDQISTVGSRPFASTMDLSSDDLSMFTGDDRASHALPLPSVGDRSSLAMPMPTLGGASGFGEIGNTRGQTTPCANLHGPRCRYLARRSLPPVTP